MPRIPDDPDPFFKWEPDGANARARQAVRDDLHTDRPGATDQAASRVRAKKWLLRWAWALSTGMLVLGYAIMAAVLTGYDRLLWP